ncbi:hypothetical protein [Nostoc sp. WHI]|nr:hypothetical protein [Nostoc sp. WHI]
MTIYFFCGDAGRSLVIRRITDSDANATVQILGLDEVFHAHS